MPTGAFKELALRSFPAERAAHVFRTSGTSTASARRAAPRHARALRGVAAAELRARRAAGSRAGRARAASCVLAPSPRRGARTRRSRTCSASLLRELGDAGERLLRARRRAASRRARSPRSSAPAADGVAVALCGTAFAFVHLLDALARARRALALPPGSRVMETGGFKGRSRELAARRALRRASRRALGVPAARIVNQYGMTELGSQFYDSRAARCPATPRRKLGPPWTRVRLVDPETGEDARPGGELGVDRDRRSRQHRQRARAPDRRPRAPRSGTASRCSAASRAPRRAAARSPPTRCSARRARDAEDVTRARWHALREAGRQLRRRPARDDVHAALARVLDAVARARTSPWRRALEAELPARHAASRPRTCARASRAGSRPARGERAARAGARRAGRSRARWTRARQHAVAASTRRPCVLGGAIPHADACSRCSRRWRCARPCSRSRRRAIP